MAKKLLLVVFVVIMSFLPTNSTSALTMTQLYNNAANNVFFYVDNDNNCSESELSDYTATATGDQITWIGDSYSVGAKSIINDKYPGVDLHAKVSKFFSKDNSDNPSGLKIAKELAENNSLRKFVVFMLGTNGGNSYSEEKVASDISDLVTIVGSDRILVLMTPYTKVGKFENHNKAVRAAAESNNKILVADWENAVKDKVDELFTPSDEHPNTYEPFVEVVKTALDTYTSSTSSSVPSTVGATLGSGDDLTTKEGRAVYIAQRLRGKGYDGDAIAGFMGNFEAEDGTFEGGMTQHGCGKNLGLITDTNWKITNSDWGGYPNHCGLGLAQWTSGGRQERLQEFADTNGLPVISLEAQVGWVLEEASSNGYKGSVGVDKLNSLGSLAETTWNVYKRYEAPKSSEKVSSLEEARSYGPFTARLSNAEKWLKFIEEKGIATGSGIVWTPGGGGSTGAVCTSTSAQGSEDLAMLAREMSWPNNDGTCFDESGGTHLWKDDRSACLPNPRAKYKQVVESLKSKGINIPKYMDCSYFVASAVRYSGIDDSWPAPGGSAEAYNYVANEGRDKWTEIENLGNTSNLLPGDVFTYPRSLDGKAGHVMIYIGKYGGSYGNMAGASKDENVGKVGNIYFNHDDNGSGAGDKFRISRYKGDSTGGDSSVGGSGCKFNSVNAEGCILYRQSDSRWANLPYGTGSGCTTYRSAGCAPSAYAMVIANLTGDSSVTPPVIGKKAVEIGARGCSGGTVGSKIVEVVKQYGLHYELIQLNETAINQALSQGKVVALSANGSSPFSGNGHYVVIRGKTQSGKWLLFNSGGGSNGSKKEYEPSAFIRSIANGRTNSGPYAIGK